MSSAADSSQSAGQSTRQGSGQGFSQGFKQELTAVFGQPVAENPTQAMIEAAYRHHDLPWRYLTIEVAPEHLGEAVRGARAMGFAGFNLTIPHKVAVIEHLDALGESARLIGAVNCVVRRGERLIGENTDGKGFLQTLQAHADPRGKRVVIFGAGGAARAISVELALAGAAGITVVNRSEQRGRALVELLRSRGIGVPAEVVVWKGDYTVPAGTDVVINATSIGLFPEVEARVPVDLSSLRPGMIVADVIPNPPRTRLVDSAGERGCIALDGLGMLVNQGVIGVRHWTGVSPDPAVMRQALLDVFGAGA
ncbi:MAG: shikimate dehydrogenase [Spirochaetales bacterium]|nr:shikimate dehydrogenase [Spirochaetales bacterium]